MSADGAGVSPPNPHGAELTIDLSALQDNWRLLNARAPGAETAAVVKADAYGIGTAPAVKALSAAGCTTFFVAHLGEAMAARAAAPQASIYVLNGMPPGSAGLYRAHGLRPVLGSLAEVEEWRGGPNGPCALHVDTGMNRMGFEAGEAVSLKSAGLFDGLGFDVVMTHFTASEVPADAMNARQIALFDAHVRPAFARPGMRFSLLNSSGHFLEGAPAYDLTRPGYALYGGNPTPGAPNPMRPVVGLAATILQTRDVPAGTPVGYNSRWTTKRPSRLATISLGYADGYPRNAGGTEAGMGGEALIGGVPCPFVGTVSMDLIILDVTDAPRGEAVRGAPAIVIGRELDVDRVGKGAKTIGYEILTSLGKRHRRRYIGG